MPSPRPYRTVTERSMSFNGKVSVSVSDQLKRPRTVPDLRSGLGLGSGSGSGFGSEKKVMTKVLINVNVQGSVGAVQVLVNMENTVEELISVVVKQYIKDGRRPIVFLKDFCDFDLHYSPFSLQCLDRKEKLATLGSRNFFMCKRQTGMVATGASERGCNNSVATSSSCSKQAENATKLRNPNPWLKFMSFLS